VEKRSSLKLSVDDESMILLSSFRYAFGRRTYITKWTVDVLLSNWEFLKKNHQEIIISNIEAGISNGVAGDDCDIEDWRRILTKKREVIL